MVYRFCGGPLAGQDVEIAGPQRPAVRYIEPAKCSITDVDEIPVTMPLKRHTYVPVLIIMRRGDAYQDTAYCHYDPPGPPAWFNLVLEGDIFKPSPWPRQKMLCL